MSNDHEPGHDASSDGDGCEEPTLDLTLEAQPRGRKARAKVWIGGRLIHSDLLDPFDAAARAKLARDTVAKALRMAPDRELGDGEIEQALLEQAEGLDLKSAIAADAARSAPEGRTGNYRAIEDDDPERHGLYCERGDEQPPQRLCNFVMNIDRDVVVEDEGQEQRKFEGTIDSDGQKLPFAVGPGDYSDNKKFTAMLYGVAGPRARILADPAKIRDAVAVLSRPVRERYTTAFGWDAGATAFRFPGGVVTAEGVRPYGPDELRVRLDEGGPQQWLDLCDLEPGRLAEVRRHVTREFLRLHERRVMFTLAAGLSLALLEPFAGNPQRVALWLKGLTGGGKSFPCKLLMNFFGDFDLADGRRFETWASTTNAIQKRGFAFRNSIYLVDDYKPETVAATQAVRLHQAYADNTGRGRLHADTTFNNARPIRGLLLSTGEDLPQNNASALARTIVVDVPNREKDQGRAERCEAMRPYYRGLTADYVAWLLREGHPATFASRVAAHRTNFYRDVAGQQNDARIASNFALVAAAFEVFADYLGDAWPDGGGDTEAYLRQDLVEIRDSMLGLTKDQQGSVIFLDVLRELLRYKKVRIDGMGSEGGSYYIGEPVGKLDGDPSLIQVSIKMALAQVNEHLRKQNRPRLELSEQALIGQLAGDGEAVSFEAGEGEHTQPRRFAGQRSRCVRLRRETLDLSPGEPRERDR